MSDQSIPAPKQVLIKVENEDHHCIWLNNCIGKRNYRTFFTFVILSTVLCFYAIAFSLSHIILLYQQSAITFLQALSIAPCSFFIVIFCFLLVIPIACLACYHCFLLYEGITTHEQLRWDKMMALSEKNLYSYGNPILNIIRALCRSHNKSYLARRKYADEIYDVTIPDNPTTTTNDNRPTNNIPEISIIHSN
ncbi:DHHC palmitoyltransferase-domain-containing protein [Pilobolus umbonatus]|nr:DHHC palmitoyltransferase-domain-containing protein [Pilobolus umbonatus]